VLLFGTFICLAVFLLLLSCILYYNYAKTAGRFLEKPSLRLFRKTNEFCTYSTATPGTKASKKRYQRTSDTQE
jgi:hypothetical protein